MILAIDIGTTAVKCALFARDPDDDAGAKETGSCIAVERAAVAAEKVLQETDARLWSNAVRAAIAGLPRSAKAAPE